MELELTFPDSERDGGKGIIQKRGIYNKFVIYSGAAHGFAVINSAIFIDGNRFKEMKLMRRNRRPSRKRKTKLSPSESFSVESRI